MYVHCRELAVQRQAPVAVAHLPQRLLTAEQITRRAPQILTLSYSQLVVLVARW